MRLIDFHNHLVPGVDDGAQSDEEALAGMQAMVAEGVGGAIVTPHVAGSATLSAESRRKRLDAIAAGFERLEALASGLGLELWRGAEVALDVPRPDLADPVLRLAGTRFVLVEFAYMKAPLNSARALAAVCEEGWQPVLAHPERYGVLTRVPDLAEEWRAAGAWLQVNGGSLQGRYGHEARQAAWQLLERGAVAYVCSDFHARGSPGVSAYRELLVERLGVEAAGLLLEGNAQRLLQDLPPLPVPAPPQSRGLRTTLRNMWQRAPHEAEGEE